MDNYPTVLLIKDNHESFPTYMSQTKNILNRETQGKVSLPGCVIFLFFFFFFYLGFLSRTFTIHGTAGEGGGYLLNSSLPLPPASQTLRH